jgi:hypothetical protein
MKTNEQLSKEHANNGSPQAQFFNSTEVLVKFDRPLNNRDPNLENRDQRLETGENKTGNEKIVSSKQYAACNAQIASRSDIRPAYCHQPLLLAHKNR